MEGFNNVTVCGSTHTYTQKKYSAFRWLKRSEGWHAMGRFSLFRSTIKHLLVAGYHSPSLKTHPSWCPAVTPNLHLTLLGGCRLDYPVSIQTDILYWPVHLVPALQVMKIVAVYKGYWKQSLGHIVSFSAYVCLVWYVLQACKHVNWPTDSIAEVKKL
jgi:hypothetical protein